MTWHDGFLCFPLIPAALVLRFDPRCEMQVSWSSRGLEKLLPKFSLKRANEHDRWTHVWKVRVRLAGFSFLGWLFIWWGSDSDVHLKIWHWQAVQRARTDCGGASSLSRLFACLFQLVIPGWKELLFYSWKPQCLDALLHSWLAGVTVPGHCNV